MTFNVITKRALSRRTVLREAGAGTALPLLGGMIPAATARAKTAANAPLRLGFVYEGERRGAGLLDPQVGRLRLRNERDAEAAGAVPVEGPGSERAGQRSGEIPSGGPRRRTWAVHAGFPECSSREAHRRLGLPGRHDHRSDRGREDRRENPVAVAGNRLGGHRVSRGLRRRLQLRLHEHHFLERPHDAAGHGEQSPGGL